MPRLTTRAGAAAPVAQLSLFAETTSLARVKPFENMWRFYRMEVWPDLLGGALLMRQWGRIGTGRHRRLDPYPEVGAAPNALETIARAKRKRGCVDRIRW